ncbi:penicillin-binding protein 2 [Piscirickettsia litoralis]|uniref:Peptidoglycan D,D-transpeptidase MrdA n=1 Tax=Piscirickettsia litoralis TaxID=1891921 RepID=A0ABX3A6F7_9GAMM|nr:penicillin-binding protein 2 [Piscirickettsia litoralis]
MFQALLIVSSLLLLLAGRLAYLQLIDHSRYSTLSRNNYIRAVPLVPKRGLIYDRNGVLLAENIPVYSLDIIPERNKNIKQTIARLGQLLPIRKEDIKSFYNQRRLRHSFDSIPLLDDLSHEQMAKFSVNQHRFPGVQVTARLKRHYTLGPEFAPVLGYVSRISEQDLKKVDKVNYRGTYTLGKTGVEAQYETLLHGKVGYEEVEVNVHGRQVRVVKHIESIPGKNLYLTIDAKLQQAAYKAFKGKKGAMVALDPKTGGVIAMVSVPSYNANLFADGISRKDYHALQRSPDHPLFNRALRGKYPPASTVKPFMALLGLESQAITKNTIFHDPGYFQLKGSTRKFRDWKKEGHGRVNLNKAVAESVDTYFYQLAHQLGINKMHEFMSAFGFGKKSGIDLPGEVTPVYPNSAWKQQALGQVWFPGETVIAGIGQGYVQATPMQLATSTMLLANRGQSYRPHVLGAVVDAKKNTKPALALLPKVKLDQERHWNYVERAMESVVTMPTGTAHYLSRGLEYRLAGKTGTAQVFSFGEDREESQKLMDKKKNLRHHTWFIAYAPIKNPEIVVVVLLEHSNGAAKIARKVMDYYLLEEQA